MPDRPTRRRIVRQAAVAGVLSAGGCSLSGSPESRDARDNAGPLHQGFPISLNTSTLRGHKLPITEIVDLAASAGYDGIEPWVDELDRHVEAGGTLDDLRRRLADNGLAVTGAIAFYEWMVDDDTRRARGLEEACRRMEQLARIGAKHMAAPPAGPVAGVDLIAAAERYRTLLELAEPFGVVPAVEVWGGSASLSRLGQAVLVAIESCRPEARILPDVFHLYRGGSGLEGVRHLAGDLIASFHVNDYPADPPRDRIRDRDRVYPGDGVAPLVQLVRDLAAIAYRGPLSVELFNPAYYEQPPDQVARTALARTREIVQKALG